MVEETLNKTKTPSTKWDKIFANDTTDKRLISKMYKLLTQHQKKKSD